MLGNDIVSLCFDGEFNCIDLSYNVTKHISTFNNRSFGNNPKEFQDMEIVLQQDGASPHFYRPFIDYWDQ